MLSWHVLETVVASETSYLIRPLFFKQKQYELDEV